jgi:predicted nucleotidyltransferase
LEAEPPTCQHTKHITQLWLNRIKGCLTEASLTSFFEQRVDEYPIREIIDRLRNSRKIKLHTFKAFLGFPEIQNYVSEHLLKNNVMLK